MSQWQPIETAPRDGTKVDVWLNVHASPRSFGMSDAWREIDCYFRDGAWFHIHECKEKELHAPYITHWMPIPDTPTDAPVIQPAAVPSTAKEKSLELAYIALGLLVRYSPSAKKAAERGDIESFIAREYPSIATVLNWHAGTRQEQPA
jgi:hypothetical protein